MTIKVKLAIIKSIHTVIWIFYNLVIFYFAYQVFTDTIDIWGWICFGLIIFECLVLLVFKRMCPVTLIARRYSDSTKDNFDIYLPNWLAKNNQLIYSLILVIILLVMVYRLVY